MLHNENLLESERQQLRHSYFNWRDAAFPIYILNYASAAITQRCARV